MSKAVIAAITALLLGFFLNGWLIMVTVGVVHAQWLPNLPTIGYWPACLISLLISLITLTQNGGKE